ncbi:MAG: hypothetical protein ABDK87_06120 [Atribacterota bacterium]
MGEVQGVDDLIKGFESLPIDEQKEAIKRLMPKFCKIVMQDKAMMQEMIPECMGMMKEMDFPMYWMMSMMPRMMSRP